MAKQLLSVQVEGAKGINRFLEVFPPNAQKRVVRSAIRGSAKPLWKFARSVVPRESGALRKSIGVKARKDLSQTQQKIVRQGRAKGEEHVFVGPRSGHATVWNGRRRDPRYYAHIVEFGSNKVPAKWPMRRSLGQSGAVLSAFIGAAKKGIKREAEKLAKKFRGK